MFSEISHQDFLRLQNSSDYDIRDVATILTQFQYVLNCKDELTDMNVLERTELKDFLNANDPNQLMAIYETYKAIPFSRDNVHLDAVKLAIWRRYFAYQRFVRLFTLM